MAERKRRGEDPADENLNEVEFDDAADDVDDVDDAFDEVDDEVDDAPVRTRPGRGRTATKARPKAGDAKPVKRDTDRIGIFGRIARFVREVVAELRKVIWPTRKELLTYTAVVVVFVSVMLAIVTLFDQGFARVVLWVFGNTDQ